MYFLHQKTLTKPIYYENCEIGLVYCLHHCLHHCLTAACGSVEVWNHLQKCLLRHRSLFSPNRNAFFAFHVSFHAIWSLQTSIVQLSANVTEKNTSGDVVQRATKSWRRRSGWMDVKQTQDFHPGDCCLCPMWNQKLRPFQPRVYYCYHGDEGHLTIVTTMTMLLCPFLHVQNS